MSEFIYHIHYRCRFKIGKSDGLFGHSEEGKSGMDVYLFDEEQLIDLDINEIKEEEDVKDEEPVKTCDRDSVYSYIIWWLWGLITVENIEVDRIGVNAYSIRIKLYNTWNTAWVLLFK